MPGYGAHTEAWYSLSMISGLGSTGPDHLLMTMINQSLSEGSPTKGLGSIMNGNHANIEERATPEYVLMQSIHRPPMGGAGC